MRNAFSFDDKSSKVRTLIGSILDRNRWALPGLRSPVVLEPSCANAALAIDKLKAKMASFIFPIIAKTLDCLFYRISYEEMTLQNDQSFQNSVGDNVINSHKSMETDGSGTVYVELFISQRTYYSICN